MLQLTAYKGIDSFHAFKPHSHMTAVAAGLPDTMFNASTLRAIQARLNYDTEAKFGYTYDNVFPPPGII